MVLAFDVFVNPHVETVVLTGDLLSPRESGASFGTRRG